MKITPVVNPRNVDFFVKDNIIKHEFINLTSQYEIISFLSDYGFKTDVNSKLLKIQI